MSVEGHVEEFAGQSKRLYIEEGESFDHIQCDSANIYLFIGKFEL